MQRVKGDLLACACLNVSACHPHPAYPPWLMEHSGHRLAAGDYIWTTHRHTRSHSRVAGTQAKPTCTQIQLG